MHHSTLSRLSLLLVALVIGWVSAQDDETETMTMTGVIGQSMKLACTINNDLPTPTSLEWRDLVYNLNRGSILIGQKHGDEVTFNDEHHRDGNYQIDEDGALVISELKDGDAGTYICKDMTGSEEEKRYELVLISVPVCTGDGMLEDEMETQLSCEMRSVGSLAGSAMDWYADSEQLEPEDIQDMSSIGIMLKDVHLVATPDMDQVTYACRSSVGTLNQECSIRLDVKYVVRDVNIEPHTDEVTAGDVVNCSARGNPDPMFSWEPAIPARLAIPSGDAPWIAFKVDKAWAGQTKKFTCIVSNSYRGMKETVDREITYKIKNKVEEKPTENGKPGVNEGGKEGSKEASTEDGGSVAGIVAGFIIGGLVLVVIVIAIICIRKKQSKKPKGSHPVPSKDDDVRRIDMDGKGGNSPPVELTKVEKQSSATNHCEQVPPSTTTTISPYDVENPQCDHVSEKDNLLADDDLDFQLSTESDMGLELNGFEGFSTADIQNDSTLLIRGSTVIDDPDQNHPQKDDDDVDQQPDSNGVLTAGDYSRDQDTLPLNGS